MPFKRVLQKLTERDALGCPFNRPIPRGGSSSLVGELWIDEAFGSLVRGFPGTDLFLFSPEKRAVFQGTADDFREAEIFFLSGLGG